MATVPEEYHDLFEGETYAIVATVMPAGTPHLTPVWIDIEHEDDEDRILFNTLEGRQKARNVARDPLVGVCVLDPEDPYRWASVRGRVVEVTSEGADEHIDSLARQYMGVEEYPNHDTEEGDRLIVRISPLRVMTSG